MSYVMTDNYRNWQTFIVAVWLGNDYPLYHAAQGYKKYPTPYMSLRRDLQDSFGFTSTKDGVSLWDSALDIPALDDVIRGRE